MNKFTIQLILLIVALLLAVPNPSSAQSDYLCGDANNDEAVNLLDILYTITFVYRDGPEPVLVSAANVNNDNAINLLDILALVDNIYGQGQELICGPITAPLSYPIVDTDQDECYDTQDEITPPASGSAFYGQDAQYVGNQPSYTDHGDSTVTDNITGLMWAKSPDMDGDGDIDAADKKTYDQAVAGAECYNLAGYDDWRLPTIKELYSLIIFSGVDPSGYEGTSTDGLIPFIDTDYFDFAYGDTDAGERIIDAQYASSNMYVDAELLFGVNFADGRIKGYGLTMPFGGGEKTFFVQYVRGVTDYGINDFTDNGNSTITDHATGLMWTQFDSDSAMTWEDALSYAENLECAGHSDWRLPNVKELQSIVDYTRSPGTTNSAAIDPLLNCTSITNEGGQTDYPFYWSATTHANWSAVAGGFASYVCFGRALGYMEGAWRDVHGAGAQRSDPKAGDPDDYPYGHGPQGDAIRIFNHVRCVRDID